MYRSGCHDNNKYFITAPHQGRQQQQSTNINISMNDSWMAGSQPAAATQQQNDDRIAADVFGTHATEFEVLLDNTNVNALLEQMINELAAIPEPEKVGVTQALRVNPQVINDTHMMTIFLYSTNFSAPDAARKFVRYWNARYKLFGPDKFCLPMTVRDALKDDSLALSRGYVQLLPESDTVGRAVCYIDWSNHAPSVGYSEDSMHRVFWYMMHVAMEDPDVIKFGVVLLLYPQEARLDQFDHSLWNSIATSLKECMPLPWRSTHIVHPNRFFSIIHPVFMSSLPKETQDRVVVHSGTKMKVLANLLRYSLPWDRLPAEAGGCVELDFKKWLSERMMKESSGLVAGHVSSSTLFDDTLGGEDSAMMGLLPQLMHPDQKMKSNGGGDQFLVNLSSSLSTATTQKPPPVKASVAKGPKNIVVKSGRKSDPRMDRAVKLKLENPSLPLLDALREGGFVFPACNDSITPQYCVVDSDNVKITQRKNQLLRRVRTAKKKAGGG